MVRIGICLVPFGTTYKELKTAALAAEQAGFESVWTWDHLISFNEDTEPVLECWTLLAALAEATQRVKIGSFVTNVLNRRPEVLAKMVATIHDISGGRVEVGIGASKRPREQEAYGWPFPPARERIQRVKEAVELMRLLWTGQPVNYQGNYYRAENGLCVPPADPSPFVMVAGYGPVSARNAVRVGDGWNCQGPGGWNKDVQHMMFFDLMPVVTEELKRIGRPRDSFEVSISENLTPEFARDPMGYLEPTEKNGVDRVVLDVYHPFDLKAIEEVGKAIYG